MAKFGAEMKNTLQSLMNSAKSTDEEEAAIMSLEEERNLAKNKENAHSRIVETAKQPNFSRKTSSPIGKSLNTVGQDNRPVKAIMVNESSTVRVMEPKRKDDVYLIISELRNRQPVMVKLGSVEQNEKRSILDTLYGACSYAGFTVEQVDAQMILIDPSFKPLQR